MADTIIWIKRATAAVTSALLVILAAMLFAIVAVAVRPLLIVLAITALIVAWVLYHHSPAFREWLEASG
jgi:hypothetical protein